MKKVLLLMIVTIFSSVSISGADERKFVRGEKLEYPVDALERGVSGQVVVKVKVDAKGNVMPELVAGFEGLNEAALQNTATWKFSSGKPADMTAFFYFRIVSRDQKEVDDFRSVGGLTVVIARHKPEVK